jgi:hypothetical protein
MCLKQCFGLLEREKKMGNLFEKGREERSKARAWRWLVVTPEES